MKEISLKPSMIIQRKRPFWSYHYYHLIYCAFICTLFSYLVSLFVLFYILFVLCSILKLILHFAVIRGIRLLQVLLWLSWLQWQQMSREMKYLIQVVLWINCERLVLSSFFVSCFYQGDHVKSGWSTLNVYNRPSSSMCTHAHTHVFII